MTLPPYVVELVTGCVVESFTQTAHLTSAYKCIRTVSTIPISAISANLVFPFFINFVLDNGCKIGAVNCDVFCRFDRNKEFVHLVGQIVKALALNNFDL